MRHHEEPAPGSLLFKGCARWPSEAPPEFRLFEQRMRTGKGLSLDAAATGLARRRPFTQPNLAEFAQAIRRDATARRIEAKHSLIRQGDLVGVRLNLNILKSSGVTVQTVHQGRNPEGPPNGHGFWNGSVLAYAPVVSLYNAWFSVHQAGRQAIACGSKAKHSMACVDGQWSCDHSMDGVAVRFNPHTTHLFEDEEHFAIQWAQAVTVVGHRVYARGLLVYHDEHTAPVCGGSAAPSTARLRTHRPRA